MVADDRYFIITAVCVVVCEFGVGAIGEVGSATVTVIIAVNMAVVPGLQII